MMREIIANTIVHGDELTFPKLDVRSEIVISSLIVRQSSDPLTEPEVPDTPSEPLPEREPDESPRIEPDPEDTPIPDPSPAPQPGTEPVPERIPTFCPWRRS